MSVVARIARPLDRSSVILPASPVVLGLLAGACVFLIVGSLVSSQFAEQTVAGLATGGIFEIGRAHV